MADSSLCESRVRIVFEPWVAPDGQIQTFDDDVLATKEKAEFEPGWLHVYVYDRVGYREWQRSYPTHNIVSVRRA